jgi:hypothetical protein
MTAEFCHFFSICFIYLFLSIYTEIFEHYGTVKGDISTALFREERGKGIEVVGDGCVLLTPRE